MEEYEKKHDHAVAEKETDIPKLTDLLLKVGTQQFLETLSPYITELQNSRKMFNEGFGFIFITYVEHKIFRRYCNWSISGRDHSKRNERKRMSIGGHRINKSFNRMEEFCGNTDFLKGRNL